MLENWAKFAGFSAILAVALAGGLTWVLPDFFPPNPTERSIAQCTEFSKQQEQKSQGNDSAPNNPPTVIPGNEAEQHNKTASQPNADLTHKYECLVAAYTGRLATFTELLALVTAFLIAIGWYQGAQLKRAVDTAEKSDEKLQRAYVWPGFGHNEPLPNGRRWFITLHNTGRTAGIIQTIHHAIISENDFNAGKFTYDVFDGRENVIPPQPIQIIAGLSYDILKPRISCGYITYEDVFGKMQRQGWKHRLRLDGNSNSLPGCYSSFYQPWKDKTKHKTKT